MNQRFFIPKYSRSALFFTAAGALATVLPLPPWIGGIRGLLYLVGNGRMFGRSAFPKETPLWRTFLGTVAMWALVTVMATIVYYAAGLGPITAFLVIAAAPLLVMQLPDRSSAPSIALAGGEKPDETQGRGPMAVLASIALATLILALATYGSALIDIGVTESIRSPWDVVPPAFFIVMMLIALLSFTAAYARLTIAGIAGLAATAALAASVAASVYGIGFGFDPFIHRATEAVILAQGGIDPKPFYYIGQYATVTLAARMLGTGVDGIDLRLMAVFLAALMPISYWGLRRGFGWKKVIAAPAAFLVLLLPLSSFAATTPQGLANALLLAVAFSGLAFASGAAPWWFPALLGAAAACIHPLAGVPTLAVVALLLAVGTGTPRRVGTGRKALTLALVLGASIALPLMFVLNAKVSGSAGVSLDGAALGDASAILRAFQGDGIATRRFEPLLDFTYAWKAVRPLALGGAGLLGLWLMRKHHPAIARTLGFGAFAFFMNYLLLSVIVDFPFLIDYERSNYADRMAELTLFILLPAAAYAFGLALDRIRRVGFPALGVGISVATAALIVSSIYLAYPRLDEFENSRGWSTSARDIEVARTIDKDANGEPYIVLANQAVSAGAISALGFQRYYGSQDPKAADPVFFYPVPTGGPLYALFLAANEGLGSRDALLAAMDLAGVDRAYYVVNHYWWDAQRIVGNAKREADGWTQIDQRTWTFMYER
jgi:hypothetical protein